MQPAMQIEELDEVFIMIPRSALIARAHELDHHALWGFKTGIYARNILLKLLGNYGKRLITGHDLQRLKLAKEKEEDG